jgi:phosphoribosylformylglycinamidine synthase
MHGEVYADIPVAPLVAEAPEYDRPVAQTPRQPGLRAQDVGSPGDLADVLVKLVGCPDLASRRWVWRQYDQSVMGDTVRGPGADAAIVRIHGSNRGLAMTVDCTPRYCQADPVRGGMQAVVETWRNLTAVGARPLAITDNMNFGNPERPEIMGQFAGCIDGMRQACLALDYPVVSGNVSLYNETNGQAIWPAPVIGGVGLLDSLDQRSDIAFKGEGDAIVLIGRTDGWLGSSLYLREILGREDGAPPPIDLAEERRNGDLVRTLIAKGLVQACHDLSDGGLLVGLTEMALAGDAGFTVEPPPGSPPAHAWAFGEDQGRYLVTTRDLPAVLSRTQAAGVVAAVIGRTGGRSLTVRGVLSISLERARRAHEGWLPAYMGEPAPGKPHQAVS